MGVLCNAPIFLIRKGIIGMNEQSRISELKGIGEKTEKLFQKMGVYTIGDLLRYYPRG